MKIKLHFILLVIVSSFLLQNCKRESYCSYTSTTQHYYNLKESNKARIPYTGSDTLIFISNLGDTAILIGESNNRYYIKHSSGLSNADCGIPEDEFNYENVLYEYNGTNPYFHTLKLIIYKYDKILDPQFDNLDVLSDYFNNFSAFEDIDFTSQLKDSVLINGSVQYGVYLDHSSNKVLFNYQMGVLKVTDDNNRIWIRN